MSNLASSLVPRHQGRRVTDRGARKAQRTSSRRARSRLRIDRSRLRWSDDADTSFSTRVHLGQHAGSVLVSQLVAVCIEDLRSSCRLRFTRVSTADCARACSARRILTLSNRRDGLKGDVVCSIKGDRRGPPGRRQYVKDPTPPKILKPSMRRHPPSRRHACARGRAARLRMKWNGIVMIGF